MNKTSVTVKTTKQALDRTAKKYCRIVLTEDKPTFHRLVETTTGQLEYRLGAGKRKQITIRRFRMLLRSVVQAAKTHQLEYIALQLDATAYPKLKTQGEQWFYQTIGEELRIAAYEFTRYKSKKSAANKLQEITICGLSSAAEKALQRGLVIADSVNLTRDIANTTGEHMQPSDLAKATQNAFKGLNASVKVLDLKAIQKLKMGLLEAVGKGAEDKPRFIIIEYRGAPKQKKTGKLQQPIVLLGKGITYDSGGLNLKPSSAMHDMHMDMSGSSVVIGAVQALAKLKVKQNVIGLIPAAENSVSERSMRSGDIITSMSGQTVEVLHTDAEGRLVLADAMTYALKHYEPKVMIDIATLTGAALVALGQHTSAVLTKNKKLSDQLQTLSEKAGDLVWPLPLWSEYKQYLKSSRADISNIATNFGRYGGCIEGGTFLSFFADKKVPWAHIDMAPRMDSVPSDKLAKGATGEPVRLLVKYIESQ